MYVVKYKIRLLIILYQLILFRGLYVHKCIRHKVDKRHHTCKQFI